MHPTTHSKAPVFQLEWSHLAHGLGIGRASLRGWPTFQGWSPQAHTKMPLQSFGCNSALTTITAPLCCSFGLLVAKLNPSLLCLSGGSWWCTWTGGGSMAVPGPGWELREQPQGAKGTSLLSMAMQQLEGISSLLPRVYCYYLYLSSI